MRYLVPLAALLLSACSNEGSEPATADPTEAEQEEQDDTEIAWDMAGPVCSDLQMAEHLRDSEDPAEAMEAMELELEALTLALDETEGNSELSDLVTDGDHDEVVANVLAWCDENDAGIENVG